MADAKNKVVPYKAPTPDNPNPQIPYHVWDKIQELGEAAVEKLGFILAHDDFTKLTTKDQLNAIKTALELAYRQQDVNKHLHIHANQNSNKDSGNAMAALSASARRRLPEYTRNRSLNKQPNDRVTFHNTLDAEPAEYIPRDGD